VGVYLPKETREDYLIAQYRWEFLRRSKSYQKDYNNIWLPVLKCGSKEILRAHNFFRKKYEFFEPLNPRLAAPAYGSRRAHIFYIRFMSWIVSCKEFSLCGYTAREKRLIDKGFSKIHLDVDLRFPKERIMERIEDVIDEALAISRKKGKVMDLRKRLVQYEAYLRTFDLKNKGLNWAALAKKFYKNDFDRDVNYAKRKVKRDYERCCRLSEFGFRQIR